MSGRAAAVFASATDHDRHRRPADAALVVVGAALVLATALEVDAPVALFPAATAFVQALPAWLDTVLGGALALGGAYVVVLALVAVVVPAQRRLLRDLAVGGAATAIVSVVLAHLVLGDSPSVEALWTSGGRHFPELRVALVTALVLIASPFVVRPVRRAGQTVLLLGAAAGVALQLGDAGSVAGAMGVGMAVAGAVHLAFGSPGGSLSTDQVRELLERHGLGSDGLARASGLTAGPSSFDLRASDGAPMRAVVFGRDAADLQVAAKLWRLLWYRGDGPFIAGRLRQAEHLALMGLLGRRAGATTPELALLVGSERGDALIVTRHPAGTSPVDTWTPDRAARAWDQLDALHRAGIVHGSMSGEAFVLGPDGSIGLADLSTAGLEGGPAGRLADQAGLLVLTALALGTEAALDVAVAAQPADQLARVAPLLQRAALGRDLRTRARREGVDLAQLRGALAERCGTELPPLTQLRRVTPRSVASAAGGVFAVWLLVGMLAGVDVANIADALQGSIWAWVGVALLVGLAARLGAAVSVLGASEHPLPLGPTWLLQLAITFINLVVPGSAARLGTVMRYYQKQGTEGTEALTAGVLDTVGGLLVQVAILVLTLGLGLSTMTFASADVDVSLPGERLLLVAAVGVLVGLLVVLAVTKVREWVANLLRNAVRSFRGLRSVRRAGMLFGGNLLAELLWATALGMCVLAVGHQLPFVDLIAINVVVALFAGLMPVPGGIGVTEAALAGSLTLAGLPESSALAAALLYRGVTFYLPPIWGFASLRWLTRHDYL